MRYVDWRDLDKDQRLAVLAHVSEPVPEWLNGHAFPVKKNGTIKIPMYPRVAAWKAEQECAAMKHEIFGGTPSRPDKGDIHHLKMTTFRLDHEPIRRRKNGSGK